MAFIFKPFTPVPMLKKLEYMGCEYFLKKTEGITYIGYGGNVYAHSTNPAFNKGLFLFGMVKKDFQAWIAKNPNPVFEDSYRPIFENRAPLVKRKEKEYSYDIFCLRYYFFTFTHCLHIYSIKLPLLFQKNRQNNSGCKNHK